jgi:serine/threonine-protein phosphatase 2A regulatory subunit B''
LPLAERETRVELAKLWRKRELSEAKREPSLSDIPRFFVRKSLASAGSSSSSSALEQSPSERARVQHLQVELSFLARQKLREKMASLILSPSELEQLWRLLRQHASPPSSPAEERINYDDFCQVGEGMPAHCMRTFFCASHFAKFHPDGHGRISVLDYFQWARRKNSLMQTRSELSQFDSSGDGALTEREIEQWIETLIPTLPALAGIVHEFFPFYKVTAVRKFLFFLDPRRRGRVPIKAILASPVTHELLELRRPDITQEELRHNWFSLAYAEMLYADYLELDDDQNGMLAASELQRCATLWTNWHALRVPAQPVGP